MDMIKAYSYNRVSTKDQQREGYSIPAQVEANRSYAKRKDIEIVREFIEADSAGKAGRKLFGEMLGLLKKDRSVRVVLVEKTDRMYRNFFDQVKVADLDVDIHFVMAGRIIGKDSSPSEKFAHDIETAVARHHVLNMIVEIKKGQRQKALQGSYPGGVVPIGYLRNKLSGGIELDLARAPILRHLFELYATGEESVDSVHAVAVKSNLTYPRTGRMIARSEIERLLKKEFYTGKFDWKDTLYQGDHPPMVDRWLFDKVQDVFKRRSNGSFSKRNFVFSRKIDCVCGNAVTAEVKKGKYVYYHCTGYGNRHKRVYIPEAVIDQQFARIVKGGTLPDDWYEFFKACLDKEHGNRKIVLARQRDVLESERSKLQTRLKKAYQDKLEGTVSEEFFKEVYNDYQKQLDAVNYRLSSLAESVDADFDLAVKTIELSYRAESLYLNANPDQKRRLITSLLSNCVLDGVTLIPTYQNLFSIIAKGIESDNMRRR